MSWLNRAITFISSQTWNLVLKKFFFGFSLIHVCNFHACSALFHIVSLNFLLISAIIGIVGCANALKATALILGRVPNVNKTTTAATTTTTSTTVATSDADLLNDEDVSINQRLLLGTRSINNLIVWPLWKNHLSIEMIIWSGLKWSNNKSWACSSVKCQTVTSK